MEISDALMGIPVAVPYRTALSGLNDGFRVVGPDNGNGGGADGSVSTDVEILTFANGYVTPHFQREKGGSNTIRRRTSNDPPTPVVVDVHASLVFVPNSDVPSIQ